ncbi:MAG TPA: hypothetical protein PKD27_12465 [Tepidiformaceae bacterium]|nr:hypothetical protein [Tepidiformaceae bacterium]
MRNTLTALLLAIFLFAGCRSSAGSTTDPALPTPDEGLLTPTAGVVANPAAAGFEPLPGAQAYFGMLRGAAFRIEVPRDWNGGLLLWARGFRGYGTEVSAELPPAALRQAAIQGGFAWASSSFSQNGYIAALGANETLLLKRYFAARFGEPATTIIAGESMGGHITVLSLERFPGEYDGGLALCGVVAGQEWFDYLLGWPLAAEFIAGVSLPLEDGKAAVERVLESRVLPALGRPENATLRGQAFASVIRELTGGARPFFDEGFRKAYRYNFGLVTGDPAREMEVSRAASTQELDYRADPGLGFDGEVINLGVRRVAADATLRDPETHPGTAPTTGELHAPLLTLHETGDLSVPISLELSYRQKVDAAGHGDLLVQRAIRAPGHCQFSDTELAAAWEAIVTWVAGGPKPPGDDLSGGLAGAGMAFTQPLRPGDPGQ